MSYETSGVTRGGVLLTEKIPVMPVMLCHAFVINNVSVEEVCHTIVCKKSIEYLYFLLMHFNLVSGLSGQGIKGKHQII